MINNTNQNPTPPSFNNYDNNKKDNSKKLLTIAGVAIALLLGTNIFLWISRNNKANELATTTMSLTEAQKLNDELEKQYNEANLQLETMKGTNADLNAQIEKAQADLSAEKNRIAGLIRQNKNLASAKTELDKLRPLVDGYLTDIKRLQEENGLLKENVAVLTTAKTQLEGDLQTERTAKQEVIAQKEAVVAEKVKVEEQNVNLSKKVDRGSVVAISDIQAQGFTVKDSGKEVSKKYAKNIERIKLCFNASENTVTQSGRETFFIRIINPTGETIMDNEASQLKDNSGKQIPYTTTKEIEYSNDAMNICTLWDAGTALKKGTYEVEIYNKGFIAGKGSFTLK